MLLKTIQWKSPSNEICISLELAPLFASIEFELFCHKVYKCQKRMSPKLVKMANQQVNTRQSAEECANPSGNTTFPPDINHILDREYFEIVAVVKISNLFSFSGHGIDPTNTAAAINLLIELGIATVEETEDQYIIIYNQLEPSLTECAEHIDEQLLDDNKTSGSTSGEIIEKSEAQQSGADHQQSRSYDTTALKQQSVVIDSSDIPGLAAPNVLTDSELTVAYDFSSFKKWY